MKTMNLDTALLDPLEKDGYQDAFMKKVMSESTEFLVKHFVIKKDGTTSSHKHEHEQLHYIVSGKGVLRTGTGKEILEPGMMLLIQSNDEHGFENPFDDDFEFLAFFQKPAE